MKPHPDMAELVAEIDALLQISPMSAPTFGRLAMNDSDLVPELRTGRRLQPASVDRVRRAVNYWTHVYRDREAFRERPEVQAAVAASVARFERRRAPAPEASPTPGAWWHPRAASTGSRRLAEALRLKAETAT